MTETIKVLGLVGSLRKGSYNRGLMRAAVELLPDGMSLEVAEIGDIPAYNGDVEEHGAPGSVVQLKERIRTADALLIATPEYNYSIPGVLKNAIDWASRPPQPPFKGKPLAIMGASMGMFGSARAQYHLRQTAVFLDMHPLNKPEVMVAMAHTKFDEKGRLVDEKTREFIRDLLIALGAWTRRLQSK